MFFKGGLFSVFWSEEELFQNVLSFVLLFPLKVQMCL